jgi:NlpC/P60 family putative phage cell wall peptidase
MACDFRQHILRAARGWIGTPYRHQCSVRGQGTDCLGLLRGVWREVLGQEPEAPPVYTADWSEVSGEERLWHAAERHLQQVDIDPNSGGDILLFRMQARAVAKHLAILGTDNPKMPTIIHAYSRVGVVETPLNHSWSRRIVAQYEFPLRRS